MNKNELRIGLSFLYFDKPITIHNETELLKAFSDLDMGFLKPITLTEEKLLQVGFERVSGTWSAGDENGIYFTVPDLLFYGGFDFNLTKGVGNFYFTVNHDKGGDENNISPDIKYLHQLQNTHFALTGNELNVNNSPHEK